MCAETGYLFGRDLYKTMPGVPIGLVASDVGGVKIETLMSEQALLDQSCGGTAYAPPPPSGNETRASPAAHPVAAAPTAAHPSQIIQQVQLRRPQQQQQQNDAGLMRAQRAGLGAGTALSRCHAFNINLRGP